MVPPLFFMKNRTMRAPACDRAEGALICRFGITSIQHYISVQSLQKTQKMSTQPRKKQRKRPASESGSEAIAVCVRIRPLVKHEKGQSECIEYEKREIRVSSSNKNYEFACTHVFDPSTTQETVFERSGVRPLLESSLMGYNSTLFAYGPTGCGKTFSILGELSNKQQNLEGLIPRAVREIFNLAEIEDNRTIKLRVSCFEIYREVIHDLFVSSSDRTSLLCREHPK
jgi:hypothetical protein